MEPYIEWALKVGKSSTFGGNELAIMLGVKKKQQGFSMVHLHVIQSLVCDTCERSSGKRHSSGRKVKYFVGNELAIMLV